ISITYDPDDVTAAGSSESNLQLAYWNTTTNTWDPIASTLDTVNHTLTGQVSHLTDFAPIIPTAEGAPTTPTGLAVSRSGDTGMSLSWTAVSGATGYLLYRDTASDGSFPYLTTTSGVSASDSGLTGGTTYYYKVTSSNTSGESAASSAVSATTCASVSNGVVSSAACTLACNSGYLESSGSCARLSGGGVMGGVSGGASVPTPVYVVIPGTAETTVTTETESEVSEAPVQTQTQIQTQISAMFTKTMKLGMSSSDVKRLQQLLNSDPDTQILVSGVGSSGNETEYFGSLTKEAVKKFQAKYGIVSSGDENTTGYGLVGPGTRAKLAEVFTQVALTAPSVAQPSQVAISVSPIFTSGISKGMSNSDTKRLQQLLNSDPDTMIAGSGVGSPGNETEYFGSLTEKAVQKFQEKYGIAKEGDSGYGYVGPKTRAKLVEVFSSQSSVDSAMPTTPVEPTTDISALQAQIQQMLQQVEALQAQLNAIQ
ncbi:peptidoglycan-binding protein, partial [Patescibacteria group bacterium]|nr:peptidoglycan-binding protein [Patescibacteria group bacterium]